MMGYACNVMGDFPRALEYSQVALKLMEEDGNNAGITDCCTRISNLYLSMEDYTQALFYIEKSFKLLEERGGEVQRSDLLTQKGQVYILKADYETALQSLTEAVQLRKAIGQVIDSKNYYDIGYCYEQLNQLDSAVIFFQNALDASKESSDYLLNKSKSLKSLGNIHFQQGKTALAIAELNEAVRTASYSGLKDQEMGASEILYHIYKSQNNSDRALFYHENYRNLQDSLFNEEKAKEIGRLEANYEFEKEKQQLAYKQEKELDRQRSMRRLILIALIVALLFIGIIYRYYRSKQKANAALSKLNGEILSQKSVVEEQKEKLEELDLAKSRFFTNISHEFRTPLTLISGMADQVKSKPDIWMEKGIGMIKNNAENLLNLVNQILDLRKLESKSLQLNLVQGDIVPYLKYLTESYHSFAQYNGLELHFLADVAAVKMDYDPDKILRITSNLLSNAIKFTPNGGHIYFQISQNHTPSTDQNNLLIRVKDTGTGISPKQLPHIFERFYQADDSITRKGEGTGIGLALTKELVKLMNGEIEVTSEVGKATTFLITLPVTNDAPMIESFPTDIKMIAPAEPEEKNVFPAAVENDEDVGLPKLLIVEDNPGVQQYLIACLQDHYQILVAENGQTGIDQAIEHMPDLIVSDVMMPEKDGYALTETLKNDERTDHIPIVLLTAKVDLDSKISGLKKGADAYLGKPFEKRELLVRLEKLLELRKKLQTRYAQLSNSEEVSHNSFFSENPFLQKFHDLVEKEYSNPELDMNQLSRSLGMSRSQVFRKLKALTGKSPTVLIRTIRLQKAKQLLNTSDLNISEIAYEVGFTSPNYFSAAFFEEFGVRPSATRK